MKAVGTQSELVGLDRGLAERSVPTPAQPGGQAADRPSAASAGLQ